MKSTLTYSTVGSLLFGDSSVFLEMQGSHLMYQFFMALRNGCDSILTHRRQRGPLVRKVLCSRQQHSVTDFLPCFPCLFPLPRHSLYQFWSSFTLIQSYLAVAAVLDGGKERVMPQLFSSSCTSWTVFLLSQQCPVQTASDCRPCASPLSHSVL